MIDITGLDKATVLAALYGNARPLGMGMLHFTPGDMPIEEAQQMLDEGQMYFDYVNGRVMKVDLSGDSFDPWLYDRDNGEGAALHALSKIMIEDDK